MHIVRVTSLAVEDIHHEENKTDAGVLVIFAGTGWCIFQRRNRHSAQIPEPLRAHRSLTLKGGFSKVYMVHFRV